MCRLIKLFIFILFTHWACYLQAQFGFEKTLKFSLDAESSWHIFEDQEGHFMVSATTAIDAQRSLLAIKLKPNGNTKWLCNYGISLEYDIMLWGTQFNNQYYFLGSGGFPGSRLFSRLSNNGVVLQDTMYSSRSISNVSALYACGVVFQQKIYAGGHSQPERGRGIFCPTFNVLDLQGNIINQQQFCDTFDQIIWQLFITKNKQINAIIKDNRDYGARLFVFDTTGNLLIKKQLFTWLDYFEVIDVTQHTDDTYTFLIEKNSRPFLLRTNNMGDTLRTYLVETNQPEDTILASFNCLTANNNFDYFLAGIGAMVKIDSNGYKTVLKNFDDNTTIKRINVAKDGGIFGCGHVLTYTSPIEGNLDLYIFKTDTLGNVIPAPDELFNAAKVVLYPNPANTSISILGLPDEAEYAYTITNTLGQKITSGTVQNETPINLQTFNQGLYFITLQNGNQSTTKRFMVE
ncbi:MAG: T9SS type A sorting domain-containing protein [Bacteroidia bacterium]|nr:T9SS type A sorting domain-containing protein [Bacteroidia bacterium]MBP9689686.1 T9SS type A sorting domain-containing protein [Bacteroidia bacterium]